MTDTTTKRAAMFADSLAPMVREDIEVMLRTLREVAT